MTNKHIVSMAALLVASLATTKAQTAITDWDFDAGGTVAAPDNSPAPSLGSGTATVLGMNNTYNSTTSTANADVLASAGASTGSGSFGWRLRGTPGNGWSTSAPIGSQGAQFAVGTSGYGSITFSVDVDTTGQAERNLAIEYTLNDTVGSPTWLNATITSAGSLGTLANNSNVSDTATISGNYVELGSGWNNLITASIPGAQNDPNLAIEVVNASTGADDVNVGGSPLNNTSGNWRLDNADLSGTSVPEPSSLALVGLGLSGLFAFRKARKA
jgi:hypothetical protein